MGHKRRIKPQRSRHYLKEYRNVLGLSQTAVGGVTGVSQSRLSRIENMQAPYDQDVLEALAKLYRTTPATLISRHPGLGPEPIETNSKLVSVLAGIAADELGQAMLKAIQQKVDELATQDRPKPVPPTRPAVPKAPKRPR